MTVTIYEKVILGGLAQGRLVAVTTYEKGFVKGLELGRREATRLLVERKFGPLSTAELARLAAWPAERLDELLLSVLDAPSLLALGLAESDEKS